MTEERNRSINDCLTEIQRTGKIEYAERLYDLTVTALRHIAIKYLGDIELADELLQDFWADIYKIADGFVFKRNGYAYLCRVMTNRAINKYKKISKEKARVSYVDYSETAVPDGNDEAAGVDLILTVEQSLKQLGELERIIIQSTYFEGRTIRQIAHELGMSKTAVGRLKNEALEKLRSILCDEG